MQKKQYYQIITTKEKIKSTSYELQLGYYKRFKFIERFDFLIFRGKDLIGKYTLKNQELEVQKLVFLVNNTTSILLDQNKIANAAGKIMQEIKQKVEVLKTHFSHEKF